MVERIRTEFQKLRSGESDGKRMSQHELDAYRRQLVLFGISVAAILLVVILAAGAFYQYIYLPGQTVARVGGSEITRSDYWTYRKYELLSQVNQYQQMAQFMEGEQAQQFQQMAFNSIQEMQDIENASIDPFTVDEMIENKIIMDALDEFGIEITDEDVDAYLVQYFTGMPLSTAPDDQPVADPTAEAWATATAEAQQQEAEEAIDEDAVETDDAAVPEDDDNEANGDDSAESDEAAEEDQNDVEPQPTPEPEPTPTDDELRATATATQGDHQRNLLDEADISHDEFVEMVVKPQIARERIQRALGDEVPTRGDHIHAAHILVATEDAARLIYDDLVENDRDFAEAAEAQSTDAQTAPNGGDLGWFPRGVMVSEFEEVAFSLDTGEISEPFQSEFGWHIVTVLDREEDRPIELGTLNTLRQRAFEDWLAERRATIDVDTGDLDIPDDTQAPPGGFQAPPSAPPAPQPEIPEGQEIPIQPEPFDPDEMDDLFGDGDPFEDLEDGDEGE